jgi:hypothetical protein
MDKYLKMADGIYELYQVPEKLSIVPAGGFPPGTLP